MKKSIWILLPLLLCSLTVFGQLEKGTFFLGGGVGFNSSTSTTEGPHSLEETKISGFNFSPDAGYFFKDNWVIGLSIPLSWQSIKRDYDYSSGQASTARQDNTSSYGVAPFFRKYFPVSEKLSFFGQAQAGYLCSSTEYIPNMNDTDVSTTLKSNIFNLEATLGLSYFPKNWLGVNLSISPLGYSYHASDLVNETKYEVKRHGLDFGIDTSAIQLGVNFFLSKK